MLNRILRLFFQWTLSLRYRVACRGLEDIASRGKQSILFLPNHPALIDPVILLTQLYRRFEPHPLASEDELDYPIVRWLSKRIGVRTIPDIVGSPDRKLAARVEATVRACAEGLNQGECILLYPAGHIYRSRYESIGGNRAVEEILRHAPDCRVVLVRTRWLWGSSFSYAGNPNPDFFRNLVRHTWTLIKNLIFFTPRRDVSIELVEPQDFPRTGSRQEINRYLEAFYNHNAPPALYVPYSFWSRQKPHELPDPVLPKFQGNAEDVAPAIRQRVIEHLRELAKVDQIQDEDSLAGDLGLDSLVVTDLALWISKEFGVADVDVAALQTVSDVILAAAWEGPTRPIQLQPVPDRWFRLPRRRSDRLQLAPGQTIAESFLNRAAIDPSQVAIADQRSGVKTYRDLITAIFALRPLIAQISGQHVAIMLPASVAADVAYLSVMFAGKTPVMLNWTTGARNIAHALELTESKAILTARPMVDQLSRQGMDVSSFSDQFVFLEELGKQISILKKALAALQSRISWRSLSRTPVTETAVVLFTSGSEALPKGVPLTHQNILSNARDVLSIVHLKDSDAMLGFLPPFHSFGFSLNMVTPLCCGLRVVHYPNPTEGVALAQMIEAYQATIVAGTPTFLGVIARRATTPEQLRSLRLMVTGAERFTKDIYQAVRQMCPQALILEGYGITECSPVVAANREDNPIPFTIGKILPSMEYAIVDLQITHRVRPGEVGLLLVRGPNVFPGYLGNVASPFVEFEGKQWYKTGDLVSEDENGILTFQGRLKRFIKRGGEMISLPAIEFTLLEHFGSEESEEEEGPILAVEAIGDDSQPEIILCTTRDISLQEANQVIRDAQLSPLHKIDRVVRVDEIPVLGTGKTDYRTLKKMLTERFGQSSA